MWKCDLSRAVGDTTSGPRPHDTYFPATLPLDVECYSGNTGAVSDRVFPSTKQIFAPVFSDDCACLQHGRGMYEEGFGNTPGQHFLYKCYLLRSGCPTTSHGNIFQPVLFRENEFKKLSSRRRWQWQQQKQQQLRLSLSSRSLITTKNRVVLVILREIGRMECPSACFDNQPWSNWKWSTNGKCQFMPQTSMMQQYFFF